MTVARFLLAALAALSASASAQPARCEVIEISDDGTTRVFSGPTRFVADEPHADLHPAASPRTEDPFERAGRAEAVDAGLLRAVAWAESRGRMAAVSPKGALGIMQLMPATAVALGIDRRNRDANIAGGARYLGQMIARFGSVPLALAAYNAGPAAVSRWGGIPPFAETRAYVAAILSRWHGAHLTVATKAAMLPSVAAPGLMLIEVPRS